MRSLAGLRGEIRNDPRTCFNMSCTTSSPTPRPEMSVTFLRQRETGQEQELEQLSLAQCGRRVGPCQLALDDSSAQVLQIYAPTVVR